ncbi:hypothetical protein ACHAQA_007984 [Verticillium albo-atrum]
MAPLEVALGYKDPVPGHDGELRTLYELCKGGPQPDTRCTACNEGPFDDSPAFAKRKRPSPDHRRALIFPAYKAKPELIWVKMKEGSNVIGIDHPELAQLSVECRPAPWDSLQTILCNGLDSMKGKNIGHALNLIIPVNDNTKSIHSKWYNKSVLNMAPRGHLAAWLGPLLFVSWHPNELMQLKELVDITMSDYRHAVDTILGWTHNPCIAESTGLEDEIVQAVKINVVDHPLMKQLGIDRISEEVTIRRENDLLQQPIQVSMPLDLELSVQCVFIQSAPDVNTVVTKDDIMQSPGRWLNAQLMESHEQLFVDPVYSNVSVLIRRHQGRDQSCVPFTICHLQTLNGLWDLHTSRENLKLAPKDLWEAWMCHRYRCPREHPHSLISHDGTVSEEEAAAFELYKTNLEKAIEEARAAALAAMPKTKSMKKREQKLRAKARKEAEGSADDTTSADAGPVASPSPTAAEAGVSTAENVAETITSTPRAAPTAPKVVTSIATTVAEVVASMTAATSPAAPTTCTVDFTGESTASPADELASEGPQSIPAEISASANKEDPATDLATAVPDSIAKSQEHSLLSGDDYEPPSYIGDIDIDTGAYEEFHGVSDDAPEKMASSEQPAVSVDNSVNVAPSLAPLAHLDSVLQDPSPDTHDDLQEDAPTEPSFKDSNETIQDSSSNMLHDETSYRPSSSSTAMEADYSYDTSKVPAPTTLNPQRMAESSSEPAQKTIEDAEDAPGDDSVTITEQAMSDSNAEDTTFPLPSLEQLATNDVSNLQLLETLTAGLRALHKRIDKMDGKMDALIEGRQYKELGRKSQPAKLKELNAPIIAREPPTPVRRGEAQVAPTPPLPVSEKKTSVQNKGQEKPMPQSTLMPTPLAAVQELQPA